MIIKRVCFAMLLSVIVLSNNRALSADLVHVRLKDRLDRPTDGYCLDILGTASAMQLDLPLFVHNCKGGPTPDSTVIYTSDGQLVFPEAGVCVTAFGVNNTVLPGTSVLLRPCDFRMPFFDTSDLQKFEYLSNGQFQLRGHSVCLAVGEHSSHTYSPADRWRVLSLHSCAEISLRYSSWDLVPL